MTEKTLTAYVMLLRGINVGGKNILPMKNLTQSLEKLGCSEIQTYIQSGNVVFKHHQSSAKALKQEIKIAINQEYGLELQLMLLSPNQLQQAVNNNPYAVEQGKTLHFYFLAAQPQSPNFEKIQQLKTVTEQFHLANGLFYLLAPDGIGRSKLAAKIEQCLGVKATARNLNTVNKLIKMIQHMLNK